MSADGTSIFAIVKKEFILVTCEHGGNRIPALYRPFFASLRELLESHRGYDAGALEMAQILAKGLNAPLCHSTVSRLLIDLNRSKNHASLYSEITKSLPDAVKREILERHYLPYRSMVEQHVSDAIKKGYQVLHISSHSFTPKLNGEVRNNDIGLLYDPKRPTESLLCRRWKKALTTHAPGIRVRMNYPYSGASDGLTAALRKNYPEKAYLGIELEINQRHLCVSNAHWNALCELIIQTLRSAIRL
jgi:predicted N-formylglutamate amidohydrolase